MRILLADDDKSTRTITSAILRKWGYQVVTASDGREAWEILQREDIRFVISDWMMPHMDGLDLCRRLRISRLDRYIYVILLTVLDDRQSLVAGMDAGADDFLVKPVHRDELRVRIRAGIRILNYEHILDEHIQRLAKTHQALVNTHNAIQRDLESAALMQKALLPAPATYSGVSLDWLFLPCSFLAGDIFDYFPLDERHLGFYQLDVAGHGIPAALLSFTLNKMLSQMREGIPQQIGDDSRHSEIVHPCRLVAELNRRFEPDSDASPYFTMVYALFDTESYRLTFTQAGHPPPIWIRRSSGSAVTVGTGGFPVGVLPDVEYESTTVQLEEGDYLFVYSDGIIECENRQGEPFSQSRLCRILEDTAGQSLGVMTRGVGRALREWKGDDHYQDDITLLGLTCGSRIEGGRAIHPRDPES